MKVVGFFILYTNISKTNKSLLKRLKTVFKRETMLHKK
jgi:hypothetical protein